MDIGMFLVPFRAPQTSLKDGYEWDMQCIRWAVGVADKRQQPLIIPFSC